MLFSIIIPIYNVEPYIAKALDSVYNQNISENCFEVIAVNDGSPDNSMQVVEQYAKVHSNLVMINQTNAGVSAARNHGMRLAKGEYITFLDPDDWFAPNSLKDVVKNIVAEKGTDIIIFQSHMNGKEEYPFSHLLGQKHKFTSVELFDLRFFRGSVWGGFYRREFLEKNNITFAEGVALGEDTIFYKVCSACGANVSFFSIPFYVVYVREGSASRHDFTTEEIISKYTKSLSAIKKELEKRSTLPLRNRAELNFCHYAIILSMFNRFIILSTPCSIIRRNTQKYLPIDYKCIKRHKLVLNIILLNHFPIIFYYLYRKKCKNYSCITNLAFIVN